MIIKTRGIVFRAIKYSESSLIVDIFTEQYGMRSYIISGVRSKKARVSPGLLQVMSLVDLVAYEHPGKGLNRIREIRSAGLYQSLPFDVRKSAVGLFMAEVARKTIREPEENERLFLFLFEAFQFLDRTEAPINNLHLHFLLELSFYFGFVPSGEWSESHPFFDLQEGLFAAEAPTHGRHLTAAGSELLHRLLNCSRSNCHEVTMGRAQRQQLLQGLLTFFQFHIEGFPEIHAHKVLQEVLE